MRVRGFIRMPLAALTVGLAVHLLVPGCQALGGNKQLPPEQQKRFDAIRAKGTQAALTVFPVVMGDSAAFNRDIAGVVAVLLEKVGMTNVETTDAVFRLPQEATFDQAAELFGEFVRNNPVDTDYALYAEFVGNPKTGPKEIRSVIVDKVGQIVLVDRQTAADREFKRAKPHTPMTCCMFLVERVRTHLRIPKSARSESGKGKLAQKPSRNSPKPDKEEERAAMGKRLVVMKKAGRSATVAVFPVRLSNDEVGEKDAAHLAKLLNKKKLCDAKAVKSPLRIEIQRSYEQKLLWDLARAFQDHVRLNPPEADYALLADYMFPRPDRGAWAVHFVICDRDGEWVIVDFQNEHHGDFQSVDPKTHDDCGRLVAKRLKGYLR